jgi:hypothetical protein
LVPDGAAGLAAFFGKMTTLRSARGISPKAERDGKVDSAHREQDRGKIQNFLKCRPLKA